MMGKKDKKKLCTMIDVFQSKIDRIHTKLQKLEAAEDYCTKNKDLRAAGTFQDSSVIDKDLSRQERWSISSFEEGELQMDEQPSLRGVPNCAPETIAKVRKMLQDKYVENPEFIYERDYARLMNDDWYVTRFLLRCREDPIKTLGFIESCVELRKTYQVSELQPSDFAAEPFKIGTFFQYELDRVGNATIYVRLRVNKPMRHNLELSKKFMLCTIDRADKSVNGRGTAVVVDFTAAGFQNVDFKMVHWLSNLCRSQCPKGMSYILVHNLPWYLRQTFLLCQRWMSENNKKILRVSHGDDILKFIARENLPDFLGGTCKTDYRAVPEGSLPAKEMLGKPPLYMTQEQVDELDKAYAQLKDVDKELHTLREELNEGDEEDLQYEGASQGMFVAV